MAFEIRVWSGREGEPRASLTREDGTRSMPVDLSPSEHSYLVHLAGVIEQDQPRNEWDAYEAGKAEIASSAKTAEEYERRLLALVEELGL